MAPIAIGFGILLTVLGGGMFAYTLAVTAAIPAFFGIPLIVLGILARQDKLRMHAMHGAALIGLIGFAFPAYRVIAGLVQANEFGLAMQEQAAMAVLCGVFVVLCVKSFIEVRMARKKKEAESQSTP